jgi:hypothetical protein
MLAFADPTKSLGKGKFNDWDAEYYKVSSYEDYVALVTLVYNEYQEKTGKYIQNYSIGSVSGIGMVTDAKFDPARKVGGNAVVIRKTSEVTVLLPFTGTGVVAGVKRSVRMSFNEDEERPDATLEVVINKLK